ncbi:MAG: DUF1810 domain-containing protein [Bacteroidetes bacterium]|nr:DUF1810 domain-containing protein [Bacteroidota bacterium]
MKKPHEAYNDADPFILNRFLEAQIRNYEIALSELKRGCKESHWMWFVFPQIIGLGSSSTSEFYAVKNKKEARAYLNHAILGSRLSVCTNILLNLRGLSSLDIFGYPDNLKFCSSMTLFEFVDLEDSLFSKALDQYCGGQRDERTLKIIGSD